MMRLSGLLLFGAAGVNAGGSTLNNPCIDPEGPYKSQPWCNASLDIDARVADMIGRMQLSEKVRAPPQLGAREPQRPPSDIRRLRRFRTSTRGARRSRAWA